MATSYAEMAFDANAFNPLTYSGKINFTFCRLRVA